jgi:hypothetical protein
VPQSLEQLKYGLVKDSHNIITETFNINDIAAYFTNIYQTNSPILLATSQYYSTNVLPIINDFFFKDILPTTVKSAINYVTSNAVGDDSIAIKMIKPLTDTLLPVLTHIFNYSLVAN